MNDEKKREEFEAWRKYQGYEYSDEVLSSWEISLLRKAYEARNCEINKLKRAADVNNESVRCMSKVFDDIAQMLNLPKEQYGDPDALMDAIEALQAAVSATEARYQGLVEDKKLLDKALSLLWFFLPSEEPNPYAKDVPTKLRHKKWHEACEVYQNNFMRVSDEVEALAQLESPKTE